MAVSSAPEPEHIPHVSQECVLCEWAGCGPWNFGLNTQSFCQKFHVAIGGMMSSLLLLTLPLQYLSENLEVQAAPIYLPNIH